MPPKHRGPVSFNKSPEKKQKLSTEMEALNTSLELTEDVLLHKIFPLLPGDVLARCECMNKNFHNIIPSNNSLWASVIAAEGWETLKPAGAPSDKATFVNLFNKAKELRKKLREAWNPVPVPRVYEKLVEFQHFKNLDILQQVKKRDSSFNFTLNPRDSDDYWAGESVPEHRFMTIASCHRGDGQVWFSLFITKPGDYSQIDTAPVIMLTDAGGSCFPFLNSWDDFLVLLAKGIDVEIINYYLESEEVGQEPQILDEDYDGDKLEHEEEFVNFMKWIVDVFHVDAKKDLVPAFVATKKKFGAQLEKMASRIMNGGDDEDDAAEEEDE